MADPEERTKAGKGPGGGAATAGRRLEGPSRRRGERAPSARPQPAPGDTEWARLALELRDECREIRRKIQALARRIREIYLQPGPGRGRAGRTPRRAG